MLFRLKQVIKIAIRIFCPEFIIPQNASIRPNSSSVRQNKQWRWLP
jgi:hypothetical protein